SAGYRPDRGTPHGAGHRSAARGLAEKAQRPRSALLPRKSLRISFEEVFRPPDQLQSRLGARPRAYGGERPRAAAVRKRRTRVSPGARPAPGLAGRPPGAGPREARGRQSRRSRNGVSRRGETQSWGRRSRVATRLGVAREGAHARGAGRTRAGRQAPPADDRDLVRPRKGFGPREPSGRRRKGVARSHPSRRHERTGRVRPLATVSTLSETRQACRGRRALAEVSGDGEKQRAKVGDPHDRNVYVLGAGFS